MRDELITAAMKAARQDNSVTGAIKFIRNQVEGEGEPYEDALKAMQAAFGLGLKYALEIERKAIERYGPNGTFTLDVAKRFAPKPIELSELRLGHPKVEQR